MSAAKLKQAQDAIRELEAQGREVVGLSILKDGYKLDLAPKDKTLKPADLINMAEK